MPVRRTLSSLVSRAIEGRVREWIDEEAQGQQAALDALRSELGEARAENARLEKRLSMAMGAIQASTTQLMQLKEQVASAANQSQQANQRATSAQHTAEAAADGVTGVEEQVAALMEHLGAPQTPAPAAVPAPVEADAGLCAVEGCSNKHRARGYCAKHYQQWKRGTL